VAAPVIDLSRHPLVIVRFVGLPTEAEFDAYLEGMTRFIIERKQKTVTILDASQSDRTPASQRKKQAVWLKSHENLLRQYSLGTAFVITSPLVRGVLTAIFWLQPLPTEHIVVGTMHEAEAWGRARLSAAGIAMPPGASP
jgi:hypothetical protein